MKEKSKQILETAGMDTARAEATARALEEVMPKKDGINTIWYFIIGGLFAVFISYALKGIEGVNDWVIIGANTIYAIAVALVTGAALTSILKVGQFTPLFREALYDVVYDPADEVDLVDVRVSWIRFTASILKKVLPKAYVHASEKIYDTYFGAEIHYHFNDLRFRHHFSVDESTNSLKITTITTARIYLSKAVKKHQLNQALIYEGDNPTLTYLALGDTIDLQDKVDFTIDPDDPNRRSLMVDLDQYAIEEEGEKWVQYEKRVTHSQNLKNDPTYLVRLTRFTKGMKVNVTVDKGYDVTLQPVKPEKVPYRVVDGGSGEKEWNMGNVSELQLPGNGYILCLVRD